MKTYDPKKVLVIFGARQLKGMAEDSIVSIAPQGEGLQTFVGADGEVARSLDPNATFEVTVSLSTASTSNEYLSNMYNYDRETGNGIAPLMVKDLAGATLFSALRCFREIRNPCFRGTEQGCTCQIFHHQRCDTIPGFPVIVVHIAQILIGCACSA